VFFVSSGMRVREYDCQNGRIYKVLGSWGWFEDPGVPIPPEITKITGISDEMVAGRLRLWVSPSALRIASEQRLVLGALDHAQPRVVPVRSDQPQQLSLGSARRRPLDTG
jgi:hypothetical protein